MTDTSRIPVMPVEKKTYSVLEIAAMLGIGKNKAYDLCNSNHFKIIRIGKAVRVVRESFDTWLNGDGN